MIIKDDLTTEVKYFGAKIGEDFKLIGYVDVKHDDVLVYHQNLTYRGLDEVEGMTAEEIQELAQSEADEILGGECADKCIGDYITLYNLGLYGVGEQ
jgi:hypothetical protein